MKTLLAGAQILKLDKIVQMSGAGTITLDGDRLIFTLMYHQGDDYTFECEQEASQKKTRSKKPS
jgi:hypothetical protein